MSGPPPKRDSQRRRRNTPASYGDAEPEVAEAPAAPAPRELNIDDAHPLIIELWNALQKSAEAKYYSDADWQRVRIELQYGSRLLQGARVPGAQSWATFQAGLNTLLVSPAEKRRVGIELKPHTADPDDEAAEDALADVLTLVPGTGTDGEA
ncbi:Terminase small subunit [Mycobacterium Phage Nergal]|nr:Terminase small subunit [Mycobacterium Phage Nergal]